MRKSLVFIFIFLLSVSLTSGCINENINIDTKVPDADKDGIPDDEDACPNISGEASNQGCPTQAPTTTQPPTTTPAPTTTQPPTTTPAPTTTQPPTTTPAPTTTQPPTTTPAPKSPVYNGAVVLDIYSIPDIVNDNLMYYLYEQIPGTMDSNGTYYVMEVNLGRKTESIYDTLYCLSTIEMIDNGAVFSSASGAGNWTAMYYNIDDMTGKNPTVKTIEGHDDWWIVYVLRSGTYKQVYSQDLKTGREYMVTTSSSNKEQADLSGTTVVYTQYNRDWDIYMASVTGGGETPLSTMTGDERNPKIDGNDVIYTLKSGTEYQLYYISTIDKNPRKLVDSVGNYAIKDGKILYYDKEDSVWKVAVIDGQSIVGYTLTEADTGDSDKIAISRTWAYVNGHLFKLSNI